MATRISTRGPDSSGEWVDHPLGIALAHRRLSVIDLTDAGSQPMVSANGRYVLAYNGEIYNHRSIRQMLDKEQAAASWRGHSDTETLLEAISKWGLEVTLARLNGMFAFALWDRKKRQLHLARDRIGEKPVYYGHQGTTFLFGSELKALAAHPEWNGVVDRDSLALYLRHNYIPSPYCIYKGIRKLLPAHYVTISDGGSRVSEAISYWSLEAAIEQGRTAPLQDRPEDLVEQLEAILADAVGIRMESDVPLGAFLSGGIDSSTIVSLMQLQSSRPVKTFSIGFLEDGYNEAEHAKAVATYLATDHTELYMNSSDAVSVVPDLPKMWDEPFSDSSQIPTFLVSRLAREQVTVCLSGDGGDELFCGYGRYQFAKRVWDKVDLFPEPLRRAFAHLLSVAPTVGLKHAANVLAGSRASSVLVDRLIKTAELLNQSDGEAFYRSLISHQHLPDSLVIGGNEPSTLLVDRTSWPEVSDLRERMMYFDAKMYLPDDILTKVDRASMSVGLEARVPLLDHRVVEFAFALPLALKVRHGQPKWLLRQVLDKHVPRELVERPKKGFGVPIEHWLRGPLRDWAESLLDPGRLRDEGYLDPVPIRRMWDEHQSGARRWHYQLWDVLMFQAWTETTFV